MRPVIHKMVPEARHYERSLREIEDLLYNLHKVMDFGSNPVELS